MSDEALRLIRATQQSFFEGIRYAREGYRLSDVSAAIQAYAESQGYSIVREYVGHGIGRNMHEAPEVPNYGRPGHGPRRSYHRRGPGASDGPRGLFGVSVWTLPDPTS